MKRVNATSVILTWEPLLLVESRGFLTGYKVAYMNTQTSSCSQFSDETTITTLSVDKERTQMTISSLDPSMGYCVAIAARINCGRD